MRVFKAGRSALTRADILLLIDSAGLAILIICAPEPGCAVENKLAVRAR